MVIREAGLMLGGFFLVKKSYHKFTIGKIDKDLRSGLFTAILKFAESAFTKDSVEYFKGNKFLIAFKYDQIKSSRGKDPDFLISYVILDKEKRVEKYIHKIILPLLEQVLVEFKSRKFEKSLLEYSQFKDFEQILDNIFGMDTYTINQKLNGIFRKKREKKTGA